MPEVQEGQTFVVEVVADSSGEWCGNGLKFDTVDEAETYARDLFSRWTGVRKWRVVQHVRKGKFISKPVVVKVFPE